MAKRQPDYNGIQPDRKNANKGTVRGRGMVEASLRETGAGRSILLDKDGRIVAGNKTFEAASDIGLPIRIVETDGTELVAVKRTDLDLDDDTGTARKLAYYDNRTSSVGLEWDAEVVLGDIGAGLDLSAMFRQDELDELLADLLPKGTEGDTPAEVDRAEELRQKWQTAPGQLWQLGEHRLICGDCTDAATVARVMGGERAAFCMTDPPYGVKYTGGTKKWTMLENDDEVNMYAASLPLIFEYTDPKAALYLCHASGKSLSVYSALRDSGFEQRAQIIWNKNQAQFGALGAQYKHKHEPIAYCFKVGQSPYWFGPNNEVTVWDIARANANEYHPTEKPPELYQRAMENSAPTGCIVYEPFDGSGTCIIACENLGRRCRAVEISPAYVAVALERWSVHTSRTPVLMEGA